MNKLIDRGILRTSGRRSVTHLFFPIDDLSLLDGFVMIAKELNTPFILVFPDAYALCLSQEAMENISSEEIATIFDESFKMYGITSGLEDFLKKTIEFCRELTVVRNDGEVQLNQMIQFRCRKIEEADPCNWGEKFILSVFEIP